MKNIRNKIIAAFLILFIITILPVTSRAEEQKPAESKAVEQKQEEDKVTGEVAASVLSAYIWRGQELSRDSIVIQPSATISYKGFSFNAWAIWIQNLILLLMPAIPATIRKQILPCLMLRNWE